MLNQYNFKDPLLVLIVYINLLLASKFTKDKPIWWFSQRDYLTTKLTMLAIRVLSVIFLFHVYSRISVFHESFFRAIWYNMAIGCFMFLRIYELKWHFLCHLLAFFLFDIFGIRVLLWMFKEVATKIALKYRFEISLRFFKKWIPTIPQKISKTSNDNKEVVF